MTRRIYEKRSQGSLPCLHQDVIKTTKKSDKEEIEWHSVTGKPTESRSDLKCRMTRKTTVEHSELNRKRCRTALELITHAINNNGRKYIIQ